MEAEVVGLLHPVTLQSASGGNEGPWHGRSLPPIAPPPRGSRLEADSMALEGAVWRQQVGCWRLEVMKQRVKRHKGGPEEQGVG